VVVGGDGGDGGELSEMVAVGGKENAQFIGNKF
jgi:hypothetical protein